MIRPEINDRIARTIFVDSVDRNLILIVCLLSTALIGYYQRCFGVIFEKFSNLTCKKTDIFHRVLHCDLCLRDFNTLIGSIKDDRSSQINSLSESFGDIYFLQATTII